MPVSRNKPIKVAYLLGSLNRGGLEVLLLDTLNAIQISRIDPICIFRHEGLLSEDFKSSGVSMIHLRPRGIFDVNYFLKLRKTLRKNEIEVVHAQQSIDALYAKLACLGLNIKIVQTFHGYDFKYGKKAKQILQVVKRLNELNVFVSHTQKKHYVNKHDFREENSQVIYNGVSFKKFQDVVFSSLRDELSIPKEHLLLGSVGNFNHVRDQMTICRFLNLLQQYNIPYTFVFAGAQSKSEPQYWDNCIEYCREQGLSENVHFLGSRKDIPNILNQLDAFIYSTEHDTFGIAVIEAIYAGIPTFANDWKVMREISENGQHAILYQTKSEKDLLKKFQNFLQNRNQYKSRAKEDAKWAESNFSIQTHIQNLEKLYNELF